jgi:hypothetical protein
MEFDIKKIIFLIQKNKIRSQKILSQLTISVIIQAKQMSLNKCKNGVENI